MTEVNHNKLDWMNFKMSRSEIKNKIIVCNERISNLKNWLSNMRIEYEQLSRQSKEAYHLCIQIEELEKRINTRVDACNRLKQQLLGIDR